MGTKDGKTQQLLEISVALEILRSERDSLRAQVTLLQEQLQKNTERAERAEMRLHEVTMTMADLNRHAILAPTRSTATEILMDGKSILRLNNPIPGRH
jgi:chromosome segregation ATPase